MTDVQTELYELLKLFDGICKENDIEYFLTGGSALGAIRHKGFIPWDDDIDIGITRPEWNKLKPILKEELPEGILLVCNDIYPTYHNPVIRIVDTRSARITRAALGDGCPKGQFLELFIHDPVPKEKVTEHKKLFCTYCELTTPYLNILMQKFRLLHGLKDDEIAIADEYFRIKKTCNDSELQKLLSKMEEEISRYDADKSDYYLLGWGTASRYYPINNYSGMRFEKFEGLDVPVPIRACNNLRIDFRNEWTDFPRLSNQTAPHTAVGEPGISGDEYMKLVAEDISLEETNEMRLALKDINLKWLKERTDRDKQMLAVRMRHAKSIDSASADIEQMYSVGKYEEITDRFSSYIELKKKSLNYTLEEDISPMTREILASSLVMCGRLTDAENVMDVERTMEASPDNSKTENDIIRLAMAVPAFYDGFESESREMLKNVRADWHKSPSFRKIKARLDISEGIATKDAEKLFEDYSEDAEAAKIYADVLSLEGKNADAENLYRQVLEKSNNGMDILDIKKRLSV